MHRFNSILVDHAPIELPGLRVVGVALHRHFPEQSAVQPHRHRWSQAIFYLGGQGRLVLERGVADLGPGTVVVLPPGVTHSFQRIASRAPLCLVIDFRIQSDHGLTETVRHVRREQLLQIRHELAGMLLREPAVGEKISLERAMVVLRILMGILQAAGWIGHSESAGTTEPSSAIRQLVSNIDPTVPLLSVVQRSGYNRDYLNRLVKKDTGLTLGQLRNQQRLTKAKELLASGMQVGSTAAMVGLPDQSYFARWFRRQTGWPPSRWNNPTCRSNRALECALG